MIIYGPYMTTYGPYMDDICCICDHMWPIYNSEGGQGFLTGVLRSVQPKFKDSYLHVCKYMRQSGFRLQAFAPAG